MLQRNCHIVSFRIPRNGLNTWPIQSGLPIFFWIFFFDISHECVMLFDNITKNTFYLKYHVQDVLEPCHDSLKYLYSLINRYEFLNR